MNGGVMLTWPKVQSTSASGTEARPMIAVLLVTEVAPLSPSI